MYGPVQPWLLFGWQPQIMQLFWVIRQVIFPIIFHQLISFFPESQQCVFFVLLQAKGGHGSFLYPGSSGLTAQQCFSLFRWQILVYFSLLDFLLNNSEGNNLSEGSVMIVY